MSDVENEVGIRMLFYSDVLYWYRKTNVNYCERTLAGEGVDYDILLEYLLYRTAQWNPKASTSV